MSPKQNPVARQIVASLLQRKRSVRHRIRHAKNDPSLRCRDMVLTHLQTLYTDANSAAESARRILYFGAVA